MHGVVLELIAQLNLRRGFDRLADPSQGFDEVITALAFVAARHWPVVRAKVVDPEWVPTRMGGPGATDDLEPGHATQAWLGVSDDSEATASGGYWYHQRRRRPAPASINERFQGVLLD